MVKKRKTRDTSRLYKDKSVKTISHMKDIAPEWYVDTGCYAINALVSGRYDRGFRAGCSWMLAGPKSVGKTLEITDLIRSFLADREDNITYVVNTENDLISYSNLGEYSDRAMITFNGNSDEIQTFLEDKKKLLMEDDPFKNDYRAMFVLDSLNAVRANSTIEKAQSGDQNEMNAADPKAKNRLANTIIDMPLVTNSIIFISNSVYVNLSNPMDKTPILKGGTNFAHTPSGIIEFRRKQADAKDRDDMAWITMINRKSRFPVKQDIKITVPLYFHKGGFVKYGGWYELCDQLGAIEKIPGKNSYRWADSDADTGFTKAAARKGNEEFYTKERMDYVQTFIDKQFNYTTDVVDSPMEDMDI